MKEMLVGRLEWEKSARGMAVRIPARRGSAFALFGPIIGIWLILASMQFAFAAGSAPPDDKSDLLWTLIGGIGVSLIIALAWLAWAFTSDTVLTLDETKLKIQRRVLGIELVTHVFPTTDVHNFKFVLPTRFWASKGVTDIRTSKIEFQTRSRPMVFAEGVTQQEAEVLIEQLAEVFKFPEYLAAPEVPSRH